MRLVNSSLGISRSSVRDPGLRVDCQVWSWGDTQGRGGCERCIERAASLMLGGPGNKTVTAMAPVPTFPGHIKPVTTQCFGGHRTGWRPDTGGGQGRAPPGGGTA